MARIQGVTPEQAAPVTRRLMDENVVRYGQVLPGTGIYGHAPTIQEGTRALDEGITAAGRIAPQLRTLMNVVVASLVGCPF